MHAFLVGAFGLMKIGFLNRVTLRHTGRPQHAINRIVPWTFGIMFVAAVLRLAAALGHGPEWLMTTSAILWALPFLIYLINYGPMLWRPSLPREGSG